MVVLFAGHDFMLNLKQFIPVTEGACREGFARLCVPPASCLLYMSVPSATDNNRRFRRPEPSRPPSTRLKADAETQVEQKKIALRALCAHGEGCRARRVVAHETTKPRLFYCGLLHVSDTRCMVCLR